MKANTRLHRSVSLLTLAGIVCSALTVPDTVKAASPPESGTWTLLDSASDEFNGSSLDTSKWSNGIWYDTSSALAFKDENVSVTDGNLILTAKKEDYNGKAYTEVFIRICLQNREFFLIIAAV